ncbi:hypothetical protein [Metabacillus sp. 84]|uniref:hypothetical protein n=1 Tax=Metabacillus sp. 84 TaxID=3404705 RepID=UPI003CFA6539
MAYILDHVLLWREGKTKPASILIEADRFRMIRSQLDRFHCMKVNLEDYVMTGGQVMLDSCTEEDQSFASFKEHMKNNVLGRGCTCFISIIPVNRSKEIAVKTAKRRQILINAPADHYLALKCPIKSLTPSFIYEAKKQQISLIFAELNNESDYQSFTWPWLRDALYLHPVTFIPFWNHREPNPKLDRQWSAFMGRTGIPVLPHSIHPLQPLKIADLRILGIDPEKGRVRLNGDADYNLFTKNTLSDSVETKPHLDYDNHIPTISIQRGRVLKAGQAVFFKPGFGEEKHIVIRSSYSSPLSLI